MSKLSKLKIKRVTSCVSGCGGPACSPVAVCVLSDTKSIDQPSCSQLEQWCPFQQQCLPLASPCQPSSCLNCTQAHHLPPGALRPRYALQNEVVFTLPAGPASHVLVRGYFNLILSPMLLSQGKSFLSVKAQKDRLIFNLIIKTLLVRKRV